MSDSHVAPFAVFCSAETSAVQSLAVAGIPKVTVLELPEPAGVTVNCVPQGVCKLLFGKNGLIASLVIADV